MFALIFLLLLQGVCGQWVLYSSGLQVKGYGAVNETIQARCAATLPESVQCAGGSFPYLERTAIPLSSYTPFIKSIYGVDLQFYTNLADVTNNSYWVDVRPCFAPLDDFSCLAQASYQLSTLGITQSRLSTSCFNETREILCVCDQTVSFRPTRSPSTSRPSKNPSRSPSKTPTTSRPSVSPSRTPSRRPSLFYAPFSYVQTLSASGGSKVSADTFLAIAGSVSTLVYRRNVTWVLDTTLPPGSAISTTGNTLAIGNNGTVTIYQRNATDWSINASLTNPGPLFGYSLIFSNETTLFIGCPGCSSYNGSVSVYQNTGSAWAKIKTINSPDPFPWGMFGMSLDAYPDVMVGSRYGGYDEIGNLLLVGQAFSIARAYSAYAISGSVTISYRNPPLTLTTAGACEGVEMGINLLFRRQSSLTSVFQWNQDYYKSAQTLVGGDYSFTNEFGAYIGNSTSLTVYER